MRLHPSLLLLPLLTAGCIDLAGTTGSGGGGSGPTTTQLSELSRSLTDDAESELASLTLVQPGGTVGVTFAGPCPDSSSATDVDGDGILDNAILTYAGPDCRSATWRDGTIAVTGSVAVVDPSANATSYNLTLTDLAWRYVNASQTLSYTATRNGTRVRTGTADSVKVVSTITTDRERPVITAIATIDQDLVWIYKADVAGTLAADAPLPDGALQVSGTWHWLRSTENWTLAVTTITPLAYDASCAAPQRIVAGRIRMTGTIAQAQGHLDITYTGCGVEPGRVLPRGENGR